MLVRPSVGWSVRPLVGPISLQKTDYVAIASRRGEERGNQLMSKTGYVEIALRLVTVTHSCSREFQHSDSNGLEMAAF
jgi:hypothetical protein